MWHESVKRTNFEKFRDWFQVSHRIADISFFFLADVLIVDNFSQNRLCIFKTAVNKTQRFFSFIFSFR